VNKLALLVVTTVLPLAFARGAGAVEREHQLGVNIGVPMLTISDKPSPDFGAAFGIHYGYGITDQFNLLVEVQYALLSLGTPAAPMSMSGSAPPSTPMPTNDPSQMWNADIGLTYVLDVLRWVPYFGALAGGYLLNGGGLPGSLILPGGEIVVGLDYLVTPKWAVGGEFSEHFLFTDMGVYTSYSTFFARTEFRWGK
jgi:hypothetical protein